MGSNTSAFIVRLGGTMKTNKKKSISTADISKAIQKFKKSGGLIKQLPDQIVPRGVMVGGKFSMYEIIIDPATAGAGGGATPEPPAE